MVNKLSNLKCNNGYNIFLPSETPTPLPVYRHRSCTKRAPCVDRHHHPCLDDIATQPPPERKKRRIIHRQLGWREPFNIKLNMPSGHIFYLLSQLQWRNMNAMASHCLFVQQLPHTSNKENIKEPYYSCFLQFCEASEKRRNVSLISWNRDLGQQNENGPSTNFGHTLFMATSCCSGQHNVTFDLKWPSPRHLTATVLFESVYGVSRLAAQYIKYTHMK